MFLQTTFLSTKVPFQNRVNFNFFRQVYVQCKIARKVSPRYADDHPESNIYVYFQHFSVPGNHVGITNHYDLKGLKWR